MRLILNDKEIIFPTSLAEFKLGQRIEFYNQYGRELDEQVAAIIAMEEGWEKELAATEFQFDKMFKTFAFFSNSNLEAVKESEFIDDIARIYHTSLSLLFEEEDKIEFQQEYVWNNEVWCIHPPELKHGSKIKFGEFIDSKQLIKDMMDLGNSKWDYMPKICAIYLRKKDEDYKEEFLYEDSERIKLMHDLPMNIAMAVGFFLTSSMNMYINTSLSSANPELKAEESLARSILISGVG